MVFKTSTPTKCHRDVTILCDLGPPLTFIDGLRGLSFSPPPRGSLFFLQPLFLYVGLVPASRFHQPLIRPQPAVRPTHTLLFLIQGQSQRGETVHVLSILSER